MSLATLLIVAGAVLALAVVGLTVLVLRDAEGMKRRVGQRFRRPPRPPKPPGDKHYYRPYWSR